MSARLAICWTAASIVALALRCTDAAAAASWPRRFGNAQNTADAGYDAALTPASVADLSAVVTFPIGGNATPIVGHGLIFYGSKGVYVIDTATGKTLIHHVPAQKFESTGTLATVTVPDPSAPGGTREENRFYVGGDNAAATLNCLNVDKILADRTTLSNDDGVAYICQGPAKPFQITTQTGPVTDVMAAPNVVTGTAQNPWPLSLEPPLPGRSPGLGLVLPLDGTPLFSKAQPIRVGDRVETRDILFTPSLGYEPSCSNGLVWAIDAYTGEKLWQWDPVVNGNGAGGLVWFSPAMSADKKHLYVTTGDCVDKPQMGEKAESIVSLDPVTGDVQWFRQARLVDTRDYDVGNSPTVVDVPDAPGSPGCHTVVNVDKDGCFYGYRQDVDIPEVGDPGYDALRAGQQRLLWRTCVAQSGATGGFDANGASFHGRWVFAQSQLPGGKAAGDNAYGFVVDACTGQLMMASSDLASGYSEGAVASGMWFIPNKTNNLMQVVRAEPPFDLLATVQLPNVAAGGGGPAIVNGTVYVPAGGIVVVQIRPGSHRSAPQPGPALQYGGPYPDAIGTRDDCNLGPPWPAGDLLGKPPAVPGCPPAIPDNAGRP